MVKFFGITTAAVLAMTTTMAFAGGGNSDNAKAMVENIKEFGGNTAAAISPNGDLSSATNGPSDSGWGNAGSRVTGSGAFEGYTAGGQVSKSGKPE